MHLVLKILLFSIVLIPYFSDAQEKYFADHLLKGTRTFSIHEDPLGLIWIGTKDGLYSYDGYRLKKVELKEGNIFNWFDRHLWNIESVNDSILLGFGNGRGLFYYNSKNLKSKRVDIEWGRNVSFEQFYNNDFLWFCDAYDVFVVDLKLEKIIEFGTMPTIFFEKLDGIISDTIITINKVGNSKNLSKPIDVNKKNKYIITVLGEYDPARGEMFDYGWLNTNKNDTIWKSNFSMSPRAGGRGNYFQIDTLTLEEGTYQANFKTDEMYSFEDWSENDRPVRPEYQGIRIYEYKSDLFEDLKNQSDSLTSIIIPQLAANNTSADFLTDQLGNVWVSASNGLFKGKYSGNSISVEYVHRENIEYEVLRMTKKDGNSLLLLNTVTDRNGNEDTRLEIFDIPSSRFTTISSGLQIDGELREMVYDPISSNIFYSISFQSLWTISTEHNSVPKQIELYTGGEDEFTINGDLLIDRSNNLWITSQSGILKLDLNSISLKIKSLENKKGLLIKSFAEDSNGLIWISTNDNSIFIYDLLNDQIEEITSPESSIIDSLSRYSSFQSFGKIDHNSLEVFSDSKNNIWLSGRKGIYKWDDVKSKFQYFPIPSQNEYEFSKYSRFIVEIEDDNTIWGKIWSENKDWVAIPFDPVQEEFILKGSIPYTSAPFTESKFVVYNRHIFSADYGIMGDYGLNKTHLDSINRFAENSYDLENTHIGKTLIADNYYLDMIQDNEGYLWLATFSQGLKKVNLRNDSVTLYGFPVKDGEHIYKITSLVEGSNNIWMITDKGVAQFDKAELKFYFPNVLEPTTNYLISHDNNYDGSGLIFRTSKNKILLRSKRSGEFFILDEKIDKNNVPPIPVFTRLSISNKEIEPGPGSILENSISYTSEITLPYFNNSFELEFSGLHYSNPKRIKYSYKLIPVDKGWNDIENSRSARLSGLNPGDYTFMVRASNPDGIWSEPISLDIYITPPWYWAPWSKMLYIIIFLVSIYGFYYWRTLETRLKLVRERKINLRLKKVDQLKDQFLANTSHELRTPLNGIIGLADSLQDGIAGPLPPKANKDLEMISSSGRRLNNLVNDILDFSKLRNNELQLNKQAIGLFAATDVVLHLSQPLAEAKELKLINDVSKDLPPVYADENRLQQMLFNLVGNAIKFTESGYVKVSAKEIGASIIISIEDTGIGIPEEKHETIFDSFVQIEETDSRQFSGTGLGLSVTRQLVELHKGKIEVNSEVGHGSTFKLYLPIADDEAIDSATSNLSVIKKEVIAEGGDETAGSNGLPQPKEPNGLRVLVVDDEPVNLEVLNNHLTLQGYEVVEAHNGLEALKKIEQDKKFDLILLDIMMPKMSGYEVCQRLREIYLPNELPIVMVTAKSSIQNIVEGLETGANDYLTKPFSKDELLSRVKTHLNLYGINKATNRFLPSQFLKAIGRDSIVEVQLGDLANQELNVFFSDLRGFTQISENMGAEGAFHLINEYNKLMGPEILKNGGFINQYQGDSIMAMFPDSPDKALTACISMQRKLEEHNKNAQIKLHSGMGLHAGPLVLGITGDGERLDTTVISDTVNIASRIEDLTKYYRTNILISESSKKRLTNPDNFDFRYLGKVRLKGKKNPIGVYECLNGEPSKVHDLKIKTSKFFSEGIDSYYQKKFPKATVAFQEVLEIHPEDETAKMFLSLSGKYIASGVPADWSGIQNIEN